MTCPRVQSREATAGPRVGRPGISPTVLPTFICSPGLYWDMQVKAQGWKAGAPGGRQRPWDPSPSCSCLGTHLCTGTFQRADPATWRAPPSRAHQSALPRITSCEDLIRLLMADADASRLSPCPLQPQPPPRLGNPVFFPKWNIRLLRSDFTADCRG